MDFEEHVIIQCHIVTEYASVEWRRKSRKHERFLWQTGKKTIHIFLYFFNSFCTWGSGLFLVRPHRPLKCAAAVVLRFFFSGCFRWSPRIICFSFITFLCWFIEAYTVKDNVQVRYVSRDWNFITKKKSNWSHFEVSE